MDEERKVVTLSDENGNEEEFELIDFVDYQEKTYAIFTPYVEEEDDDDEGDVEVVIMEHIKTIETRNLCDSAKNGGCGECQTSCQSACKTSCGIANQKCESAEKSK